MNDTTTRSNIARFYQPLEMPGGWTFNHVEQLKTNILYYNGKYKTGKFDNRGFYKFFYNITKPACDVATKFVDLDTKDIILYATQDDQELMVWMMQRKLKQWLKDTGFASLLNEISQEYPKGHIILKKVKDAWKMVQVTNIRTDISTRCLDESSFVYELVGMSRADIDNAKFSNQDEVAELLSQDGEDFLIYECYDKKGGKWVRTIKGGLWTEKTGAGNRRSTEAEFNDTATYLPACVLDEMEVDKLPYRELKWEDMAGRWLGYGFPEYLEDNQIAENEAENLERKALALKALQIWQTRDDAVGGQNALSDAENGDILKIESEITPVNKENSDLAAFNATRGRWGQNKVDKTFTNQIATGGDLPSRTPIGVANLQAGMVQSYFELKRENLGIFIKKLLTEDVIPDFKKQNAKEHILTFYSSDEDIARLHKLITDIKVGDASVAYAMKHGFFPSKLMIEDARQRINDQLKKNKNCYMKVDAGAYDNTRFTLDINITGEQIDNGAKSQVIQLGMQMVMQGALQNPQTKKALFSLMSLGGVSPVDLGWTDDDTPQQPMIPMQPQGSMAKPSAPIGPSPMTATTQL